MNSELRKALETITSSINELKESNKQLWMTVETMKVSIKALEESEEDIDPDILKSINDLQPDNSPEDVEAPKNSSPPPNDPMYDKAVMVIRGSRSGVKHKDLQSILGCSLYQIIKIRERMVADGLAFNPTGGKIYPIVNGQPRGWVDRSKLAQPETLKKARDAIMKIKFPVADKSSTDITNMIREGGTSVTNSVVRLVLDEMVSEGLVVRKSHPNYKGRFVYSF